MHILVITIHVASLTLNTLNIDLIINYDLHSQSKYYIHHVGRITKVGKMEELLIMLINLMLKIFKLFN